MFFGTLKFSSKGVYAVRESVRHASSCRSSDGIYVPKRKCAGPLVHSSVGAHECHQWNAEFQALESR